MASDPFESARLCDRIVALTVERDELKAGCSRLTTFGAEMQAERDEAIRERDAWEGRATREATAADELARMGDAARKDIATLLEAIAALRTAIGWQGGPSAEALFRQAHEIAKRTGYAGGQGDG